MYGPSTFESEDYSWGNQSLQPTRESFVIMENLVSFEVLVQIVGNICDF